MNDTAIADKMAKIYVTLQDKPSASIVECIAILELVKCELIHSSQECTCEEHKEKDKKNKAKVKPEEKRQNTPASLGGTNLNGNMYI